MSKFIATCAASVAALVLFVPTFISESLLFPFITGKNLLFRLLVLVTAIVCAYGIYESRKIKSINTWTHKIFAVFVVILGISAFIGENSIRSFWSNFERMEGWFTILVLLVFFAVLYQCMQTVQAWRTVVKVSLIANVYIAFFALAQYFGKAGIFQSAGTFRPDSTLGNSSYLGGYALMYIFLIAWLYIGTKNMYSKVGYGALIVLNIIVMTLTLTRGSILGLAASIFVSACMMSAIFFIKRKKNEKTSRAAVLAPIALGVFILGMGTFFLNRTSDFVTSNRVLNRIATISLEDKSVEGRLINWGVSWEGFKEKPLLGYGQDNFLYVFSKQFDPRMSVYEAWYDRSHNVFFDWLIAGGILGLIAYLALYGVSFYMLWIKKNAKIAFGESERIVWTGFLIAYFIHNFFVFDNIASYILFAFVLAYITWKSYVMDNKESSVHLSEVQANSIAIVIAGIALAAIITLVYSPWKTATTLIQAMQYTDVALTAPTDVVAQAWTKREIGTSYTKQELLTQALQKFTDATLHPLGRTEAREQLAQKLLAVVSNTSISEDEKNMWAQFTFSELDLEIESDPNNPRTYQIAASLWMQFGKATKAVPLLEKAQTLSPKKQLIMFDRAAAQQLLGNYEKALEINKIAYELNPNFLTAQARYIFALYRAGKDTEAEVLQIELIKKGFTQKYDIADNKANYAQVQAAKIDYRTREAIMAYQKKDMIRYQAFVQQAIVIDPSAGAWIRDVVKTIQ